MNNPAFPIRPAADARGIPPALLATLTGIAIFALAYGGILLTRETSGIAMIWAANAVLVAVLLRQPPRDWPILIAAAFLANTAANAFYGDRLFVAAGLALCNMIEVLIVAVPLYRFDLHRTITKPRALGLFYALALGPAPLVSAALAAMLLSVAADASFRQILTTWYAANALGLVMIAPLLCSVRLRELWELFAPRQIFKTGVLLSFVVLVLYYVFFYAPYPALFLAFPPLLLATFRLGFAGGSVAMLVTSAISLAAVATGHGPFNLVASGFGNQVLVAQLFLAILSFTMLQTGAALAERRRLERALIESNNAHREAQMRAESALQLAESESRGKSAFLANMSHELRTPLNAVIGFAEVLKIEAFGPMGVPRYREYAENIHTSGKHLLALINDVLDLSRIDAGKETLREDGFDLNDLAAQGLLMVAPVAQSNGVRLERMLSETPLILRADKRRVLQILLNLLSNAVKFTPRGGRVTVFTAQTGMGVQLTVSDSGIGIAPGDIEKVLKPFGQVDNSFARKHHGTGLGLPLAKQLAELHGGRLEIESIPDVGTTVTVTLPGHRLERPDHRARDAHRIAG